MPPFLRVSFRSFDSFSFLCLAIFLFLLACYSKAFAYFHITVGGFPLYVSEVLLASLLIFRSKLIFAAMQRLPRIVIFLLSGFVLYGGVRLLASIWAGAAAENGLVEALKQFTIVYLATWMLIGISLNEKQIRFLFWCAIAGVTSAQVLGWLGFLLMGTYGEAHSTFIGFPVGNEMVLALFPVAFILSAGTPAWLISISFGLHWAAQFLVYLKRAWLASMLVFVFPLFWIAVKKRKGKVFLQFALATCFGLGLALWSVKVVKERAEPLYYHFSQKEKAEEQRKHLSWMENFILRQIDPVFPYVDPMGRSATLSNFLFKGEIVKNESGKVVSFMAFRMHLWQQAWDSFLSAPLFGVGFGTRILHTQVNGFPAMVGGRWISGPHNSYLTVLARLGLVGGILFFLLLGALAWNLKTKNMSPVHFVAISCIFTALFFAFFNVCLENPQGGIWFWLFWGWAMVTKSTESSNHA
jgi:hypothetical protein